MKQNFPKHIGRAFVYMLLSLFMCMVAGNASAKERNPVVKIDNTSYTISGTEVTLRLWMINDYYSINIRDFCARFTGDVNLYIDDKEVVKLNTIWSSIAGATRTTPIKIPTDNPVDINIDGINVGTALFNNLQYKQTCPDNSNTTEKLWWTVDLKLSFNKSFSYYGHKITVKGKWQDKSSGSVVEKDVALDNTINGFVRPINLKAQPSGGNMVFSWEQEGYNPSASTLGKWIVYKREGNNNVKVGEVAANEHSLSIEKKQYSCSNGYIITFLPNVCEGEETVCGLTTSITATGHQPNTDDICQICGHSFFRYHTSDGNIVDISNKDFGANVVSHEVVNSECVIEFDAPITRIPAQAFKKSKIQGNLVIPNSVTTIEEEAFYSCPDLNGSLTLPNSLKMIGNRAFWYCYSLKGDLIIPNSVTTIGDEAFYLCSRFTGNLTLPNSVTTIGKFAFDSCSGFTGNLIIPNPVTTIGKYAFRNCSGFTNLKLSENLTVISDNAFDGCKNLSGELIIPASVKEIGNYAFQSCTNINKNSQTPGQVTLPKSLEFIGIKVFIDCEQINSVKFQSLPIGINDNIDGQQKTVSLSDDSYFTYTATGTVDAISYTRQMSNDWGTLVLPYSLTLTGSEPYRLYAISAVSEDELVLKQLEGVVAAGTPCVVHHNNKEAELSFKANNADIKTEINGSPVGNMTFNGTYFTEEVTKGYVIAKDCFWNVAELMKNKPEAVKGAKVGPFRAWLDGNAAGPARLAMRIDGSTTGINTPDALDVLNDAEAEYYDLSGKRLHEPQKGVNIVRMKSGKTKKIIIK